jgi:mRNA interferase RelE/StbE
MYRIVVPECVLKELKKIHPRDQRLILKKIEDLKEGNFHGDKALKGRHDGKFRKRAGNYRIVYLKEGEILLITLVRIAHRKEVY